MDWGRQHIQTTKMSYQALSQASNAIHPSLCRHFRRPPSPGTEKDAIVPPETPRSLATVMATRGRTAAPWMIGWVWVISAQAASVTVVLLKEKRTKLVRYRGGTLFYPHHRGVSSMLLGLHIGFLPCPFLEIPIEAVCQGARTVFCSLPSQKKGRIYNVCTGAIHCLHLFFQVR